MAKTLSPCILVFSVFLTFALPRPAAAAELIETGAMLRMTWGLLVVLGIMLILYAMVRKRFSLFQSPSGSAIKVVELRHLMPKKSLCLVEVNGRHFLLGLSTDRVSLIAEVPAEKKESFASALEQSTVGTAS